MTKCNNGNNKFIIENIVNNAIIANPDSRTIPNPLAKKFAFYTPYQFAGNKPIFAVDLDGLEDIYYMDVNIKENANTVIEVASKVDIGKQIISDYQNQSVNKGYNAIIIEGETAMGGAAEGHTITLSAEAAKSMYLLHQKGLYKANQFFPEAFLVSKALATSVEQNRGVSLIVLPKDVTSEATEGANKGDLTKAGVAAETVLHELGIHALVHAKGNKPNEGDEHIAGFEDKKSEWDPFYEKSSTSISPNSIDLEYKYPNSLGGQIHNQIKELIKKLNISKPKTK